MDGARWNWILLTLALGCDSTKQESDWVDSGLEAETASDDGTADDGTADDGTADDGTADDDGADDDGADDDGADDDGADDDGADDGLVLPSGLNGTPVDPSVPLISFSARNSDGSERSMSDLVDGPTVIWFYPAAGTYG